MSSQQCINENRFSLSEFSRRIFNRDLLINNSTTMVQSYRRLLSLICVESRIRYQGRVPFCYRSGCRRNCYCA